MDTHVIVVTASQTQRVRDTGRTEDPEFGLGTIGFFRLLLWGLLISIGY